MDRGIFFMRLNFVDNITGDTCGGMDIFFMRLDCVGSITSGVSGYIVCEIELCYKYHLERK